MIISCEALSKIRSWHPDKVIGYCSGTFDLMHSGHILFFLDCKKYCDILVVGVGPDKEIRKNKGPDRPILNQNIRLFMVDQLKPIDYSILNRTSRRGENTQDINGDIFLTLKPDVYILNSDASDIPYRKKIAFEFKVKIVILERTCPKSFNNISTSKIIQKIRSGGKIR